MTDKEKAKEYCEKEKWCIGCSYPLNCKEVSCFHKEDYKCGYLDVLAEGRKEVREHETTCVNRLHFIEQENAELKTQIEKLEADSASKDECIDNLEYQLKDAGGELELWQRENAELKKTNSLLYEQEKEKIKIIDELKKNTKWYKPEIEPEVLKPILFRTVFDEYVSGTFKGCDIWDSAGMAYYSTDQIKGWCYLPEWDTVKVD